MLDVVFAQIGKFRMRSGSLCFLVVTLCVIVRCVQKGKNRGFLALRSSQNH